MTRESHGAASSLILPSADWGVRGWYHVETRKAISLKLQKVPNLETRTHNVCQLAFTPYEGSNVPLPPIRPEMPCLNSPGSRLKPWELTSRAKRPSTTLITYLPFVKPGHQHHGTTIESANVDGTAMHGITRKCQTWRLEHVTCASSLLHRMKEATFLFLPSGQKCPV